MRVLFAELSPIARAILKPSLEIRRTKLAFAAFVARRLFSTMSQRCAVKLQGMPDRQLASMVIVAVVPAQWQWMWSAPHRTATRASQSAFGTIARFLIATIGDLPPSRSPTAPAV